jgi:hypothetical protein
MAQAESSIRIPVTLCYKDPTPGEPLLPLEVPGLIAIPGTRLQALERVAILAKRFSVAMTESRNSPLSTDYFARQRDLDAEIEKLSKIWDIPQKLGA